MRRTPSNIPLSDRERKRRAKLKRLITEHLDYWLAAAFLASYALGATFLTLYFILQLLGISL